MLSLCRSSQVCTKFYRVSEDERLWRSVCSVTVPIDKISGILCIHTDLNTLAEKIGWKAQCRKYYEGQQDTHLFPYVNLKEWRMRDE